MNEKGKYRDKYLYEDKWQWNVNGENVQGKPAKKMKIKKAEEFGIRFLLKPRTGGFLESQFEYQLEIEFK
jgi:hypothetical protein